MPKTWVMIAPVRLDFLSVVHLDCNHPLTGQTLHFTVKVLDVRAASDEEVAHGHAHGAHGHHH